MSEGQNPVDAVAAAIFNSLTDSINDGFDPCFRRAENWDQCNDEWSKDRFRRAAAKAILAYERDQRPRVIDHVVAWFHRVLK